MEEFGVKESGYRSVRTREGYKISLDAPNIATLNLD